MADGHRQIYGDSIAVVIGIRRYDESVGCDISHTGVIVNIADGALAGKEQE